MAFGVFMHRSDSIYDDSPAERYHFPKQYLGRVSACVGDWIVYYEPRAVAGTRGYFAVARVERIVPDPSAQGMYFALIEASSYLPFTSPVGFYDAIGPVERGLLTENGRLSGRAQSAVRPISPADFNRILDAGIDEPDTLLPREDDNTLPFTLHEERTPFVFDDERERITVMSSRPVRERVFRQIVLQAYDERCAVTGLKLINGGGRAEVEAAHIKPVSASGPDIINNGLALSGTAHWMFDRGLISLADDLEILVSRQINDIDSVRSIINKTGYVLPPRRLMDRPHPHFLRWHREQCFKH